MFNSLVLGKMIRGKLGHLILALLAVSNAMIGKTLAGFTSTFSFHVEECTQIHQVFNSDNVDDTLFSGFNGTKLECLDGEGILVEFKNASNGVYLATSSSELKSNFDMSKILQGYTGDLFTVAIWFSLDSNLAQNDQILMEIEGGLKITPLSVEIISAGSLRSGNLDPLPQLPQSNLPTLMVVSVGMKTGRIYRRQLNESIVIEREFALPESVLNSNKIVMPRMSSWPKLSRMQIKFHGTLFRLQFFENATVIGESVFASGPPELRPKCPSIRPMIIQSAWEHTAQFEITTLVDSTIQGTQSNGGPPRFLVVEKPRFGNVLSDDGTTKITKFPAAVKKVIYKSDDGDFKQNDTLPVRAISDVKQDCISASTAQVNLIVAPVNDPPLARDVYGVAQPGPGLDLELGGFDPDESLYEMRGGAAAVELRWTSASLSGLLRIGPCNTTPGEIIQTLDSQSTYFRTENGTGWPITVCYIPDYSNEKYSKVPGKSVVGEESFTFSLIDDEGLISLVPAVVRIDVLNPTMVARDFNISTTEEIPMQLNLTQSGLVPNEAWLESPPKFGHLYSPRPENVIAGPIADVKEVFYSPRRDFAGVDSFSIQIKDVNGFLSQPIWIQVDVGNTYDPPKLRMTNLTYHVHLHDRTILGLGLQSPDPDIYELQVSMSLEDATTGLVAVGNISSLDIRVILGSACIDTGCQEPVRFEGFPSQIAQALKRVEYAALLPRDNKLKISLSTDAIKTGQFGIEDEIELEIISADANVWGSTLGTRGDRAVGAAIIGSVFAIGLVLGKGLWMLLPLACRDRLLKICRFRARKKVRQYTRPSSSSTTMSKTLLNPPMSNEQREGVASSSAFQASIGKLEEMDSPGIEDLGSTEKEPKTTTKQQNLPLQQQEGASTSASESNRNSYSESLDIESDHSNSSSSSDLERTGTCTNALSEKEEEREVKVLALV